MISGTDGSVGREIVTLLRKNKKYNLFLLNNKKNNNSKKKIFYQNLTKPINLKIKPYAIIHCAAKHGFSKKRNDMKSVYKINNKITKNLIEFSNKNNVKKLIFLSSMDVYGEIKKKTVNENFKPSNSNLYGKSKFLSEKFFCQKNNTFKVACLRIPGVFTFNLKKNHPLIIKIVKKIISNESISVYNLNKKFNNILDTFEIVRFINIFLNKKKVKSDYYNFCASDPISFINVIKLIKSYFKSNSKLINLKSTKTSFTISNRKISKEFNFKVASTKKIINRCCKKILNNNYITN